MLEAADYIDGLLAQHHRDSAELRRLCAARDDARRVAREAVAGFGACHERNTALTITVLELRGALIEMVDVAERVDGWQSFPQEPIDKARAALTQQEQS